MDGKAGAWVGGVLEFVLSDADWGVPARRLAVGPFAASPRRGGSGLSAAVPNAKCSNLFLELNQ